MGAEFREQAGIHGEHFHELKVGALANGFEVAGDESGSPPRHLGGFLRFGPLGDNLLHPAPSVVQGVNAVFEYSDATATNRLAELGEVLCHTGRELRGVFPSRQRAPVYTQPFRDGFVCQPVLCNQNGGFGALWRPLKRGVFGDIL
jgi:hypothetical protein